MADITMCLNGCKAKDTCYRFLATPCKYSQSYADFKPDTETNLCEFYWKYYGQNKEQILTL